MKVCIRYNNKSQFIEIESKETVEDLKLKIADITNVIPLEQELNFDEKQLHDDLETMKNLKVSDEDTFFLSRNMKPKDDPCEHCEEAKALHYCELCDEKNCSSCLKISHKRSKKAHIDNGKVFVLKNYNLTRCSTHKMKLDIWCDDTNSLVCLRCAVEKKLKTRPVEEAFSHFLKEIEKKLKSIEPKITLLKKQSTGLYQIHVSISNLCNKVDEIKKWMNEKKNDKNYLININDAAKYGKEEFQTFDREEIRTIINNLEVIYQDLDPKKEIVKKVVEEYSETEKECLKYLSVEKFKEVKKELMKGFRDGNCKKCGHRSCKKMFREYEDE